MDQIMKSINNAFVLMLVFAASIWSGSLRADIVWNEPVNGDLSSVPGSPTAVSFLNGSNTIIGTLSEPNGDLRDYLTFTIGPDQFLTGLFLDAYVADGVGFQGINSGNTSFIPEAGTAGSFLGLEFVFSDFIGTDMLPLLADSAASYGSIGFTVPLGPGTYSYVIQEITPGQSTSYQLSFNVVPEPTSAGFFCVAGLLLSIRRRRLS
jgi:hypothetical protein